MKFLKELFACIVIMLATTVFTCIGLIVVDVGVQGAINGVGTVKEKIKRKYTKIELNQD